MNGHLNPCNRLGVPGYVIFCRKCSGGIHFLHIELPQGSVTGSRYGYEHWGHCANLTIRRASSEGSSGSSCSILLRVELGVFERGDRRGREELVKDINGDSTSTVPSDCTGSSSVCKRASAQSRVVFGEDATVSVRRPKLDSIM